MTKRFAQLVAQMNQRMTWDVSSTLPPSLSHTFGTDILSRIFKNIILNILHDIGIQLDTLPPSLPLLTQSGRYLQFIRLEV